MSFPTKSYCINCSWLANGVIHQCSHCTEYDASNNSSKRTSKRSYIRHGIPNNRKPRGSICKYSCMRCSKRGIRCSNPLPCTNCTEKGIDCVPKPQKSRGSSKKASVSPFK